MNLAIYARDCLTTERRDMKKNLSSALCFLIAASFYLLFPAVKACAQTSESELQASIGTPVNETKQLSNAALPIKNPAEILALEQLVFDLINKKRAEFGLPLVVWSDDLARLAHAYSNEMATNDLFSHQGLDGKTVGNRADSMGIKKWRSLGENIAYNRGHDNPSESVVDSWMRSPGHRENILNNRWQKSGVGIAVTPEGTFYFTQIFLRK